MDWKIKRDTFYSELYERYGKEFIDEAGYFENNITCDNNIDDTLNILCTPIASLKRSLAHSKKPVIILATGSFCPMHFGHVDALKKSAAMLRSKGYDSVHTYVAPDHDSYISHKNGKAAIPVWERIGIINEQIAEMENTYVDPWVGVFNGGDVNFTEAIERLGRYVKKWTGVSVPIYFMCGGDNARFSLSFIHRGNCIVIGRPGYSDFDKYRDRLKNHDNILFIDSDTDMSSTKIRKPVWDRPEKVQLNLRCSKYDASDPEYNAITELMDDNFSFVNVSFVQDQRSNIFRLPDNTINLDSVFTKLSIPSLAISRCYDIGGMNKLGYVNRPGSTSLDYQLDKIAPGDYYLFDDDIHTGSTMDYVSMLLKSRGITVTGRLSFTISKGLNTEILDMRDFLPWDNSGLVVELPDGDTSRVPYIYPYVDPYIRGSIQDPLEFSLKVWKIWLKMFKDSTETLSDYPYFRVFRTIGFAEDTLMEDIVAWHIKILTV